jgi:hypothetical protein
MYICTYRIQRSFVSLAHDTGEPAVIYPVTFTHYAPYDLLVHENRNSSLETRCVEAAATNRGSAWWAADYLRSSPGQSEN